MKGHYYLLKTALVCIKFWVVFQNKILFPKLFGSEAVQ